MSEIKSTLDLVMEKTKHLSMTDEEKLEKEKQDVLSAIKGLVQKYQDQLLSLEMFKKELDDLHQHHAFEDKDILLNEIFSRIDLGLDNSRFFDLLGEIFNADSAKLMAMQRYHEDELKRFTDKRVKEIRHELNEKYAVSGSAVVPNPEGDPSRQAALNDMKSRFHSALNEAKSEIAKSVKTRL